MKKSLLALAVCVLAVSPSLAMAASSISGSFVAAPSESQAMPLYGQDSCSVVISGTSSGIAVVPLASTDNGRSYTPVTGIGNGYITTNGTYAAALPIFATNFKLASVQRLSPPGIPISGTVVYSASCSAPVVTAYNNPKSLGAKCDGTSDDSAIIPQLSFPSYLSSGTCYIPTYTLFTLPTGRYYGDGSLKTSESGVPEIAARNVAMITAAPSFTNTNLGFNGDQTNIALPMASIVTGTYTGGHPTGGAYYTNQMLDQIDLYMNSFTGFYNSVDGSRTNVQQVNVSGVQSGPGDLTDVNIVCNDNASNTSGNIYGSPACFPLVVSINANTAHTQSTGMTEYLSDNNFDSGMIGFVVNGTRKNGAATQGALFESYDSTSNGLVALDSHFEGNGKARIGLDLVSTTFDANGIAIATPANSCWYMNGTNNGPFGIYSRYVLQGNEKICYKSAGTDMEFSVGTNTPFLISTNKATIAQPGGTYGSTNPFLQYNYNGASQQTFYMDGSLNVHTASAGAKAFVFDNVAAGLQGFQPNGLTGGYAPEVFPLGVAAAHPRTVTGSGAASVAGSVLTFPNTFAFADTTYTCTLGVQGATPTAVSYAATSTTTITVYAGAGTPTVSYACTR